MTASPWAPSNAGGAVAPHITTPTAPNIPPHAGPGGPPLAAPLPPYMPAPPPRGAGPRLWPIIAAFSVLVVAAIAITAVITSAIVKTSPPPVAPPPAPSAPQYSATEQASAKQNVCHAFDTGERGGASQGGVVTDGQLNVPVVLRTLNTVVAVRNALTPATPTDVSEAADKYLTTSTDLTTAALANTPVDKLIDLTKTSNSAIDSLADVCGLPR